MAYPTVVGLKVSVRLKTHDEDIARIWELIGPWYQEIEDLMLNKVCVEIISVSPHPIYSIRLVGGDLAFEITTVHSATPGFWENHGDDHEILINELHNDFVVLSEQFLEYMGT